MQTQSTPWSAHRKVEALAAMAQHGRIEPHIQALLTDLWSSVWQAHQRGQLFWSITTRGSAPTFGPQHTPVLELVEAWCKAGGLDDGTDDRAARITDRTNIDGVVVVPADIVERTTGVRSDLTWFFDDVGNSGLLLVIQHTS